jgi:hypothetical protein
MPNCIRRHKRRINTHTDIHAPSRIRTHHPSLRASEDSSCLRPRGHCGRPAPLILHVWRRAGVISCLIMQFSAASCWVQVAALQPARSWICCSSGSCRRVASRKFIRLGSLAAVTGYEALFLFLTSGAYKLNAVAFSPQASYTVRATAASRRS